MIIHPICYFISFLLFTISNAQEIHKLEALETLYNFTFEYINTTSIYFYFDTLEYGSNVPFLISFNLNYTNITSIEGKAYTEEDMEKIKTETLFTYNDYFHIDNNYLFPFKSANNIFTTKNMFCIKVTFIPNYNSTTLTAALTHSNETYITESIHEEFTYAQGVPKLFIYAFSRTNESNTGILFKSSNEQMNFFTEDIFTTPLPSYTQTNIYGHYRESETGFSLFTIIFISKGETIELDVDVNDKYIETSICDNKANEVRQSIEIKNAYKPFYLIETFAQQDEKYYVYFNLLDKKNVTIYHKNNINGSIDDILDDDGFVPIEHGIAVSTTKYDIFKIESERRCEFEMAYFVGETNKILKLNEMFLAVIKYNTSYNYTYTNVKEDNHYEFVVLNNKDVTIYIVELTKEYHLNNESSYYRSGALGNEYEQSLSLEFTTSNEDGEVFIRGSIARYDSFKTINLLNTTSVNFTSEGNISTAGYEDIAIELPRKDEDVNYDSISISIINKGVYTNLKVSYNIYSDFQFNHIPFKKPNQTIQSDEKYEFYIYNPYYMTHPDDVPYRAYTIGIHVDTNSTLDYEVYIEFITNDNQELHEDNEIQISQNGIYRLDNPYQQHKYMLIIVSRCTLTSSQINITLLTDGTQLKRMQPTNLMDYYLIDHKNYIFDLEVSINSENENVAEQFNVYYAFTYENDVQYNKYRKLGAILTDNDNLQLKWKSPFVNTEPVVEYKIYIDTISNAPMNYNDKSFLCYVLDLIHNGQYNFTTNSFNYYMSYNIQLNQTDTTYFAVVVGKRVSELSVNFLYEPIIFDSLSSFSNTVLVVIIVVIVVIIVIVWRSIKNKRKSESKVNNFYKLNN